MDRCLVSFVPGKFLGSALSGIKEIMKNSILNTLNRIGQILSAIFIGLAMASCVVWAVIGFVAVVLMLLSPVILLVLLFV